ncbi:MAG TPA: ABC transporter permease [Rhizobiaceae bacterium]|nr:ABC transporter permease [Rhizobiaceae bacterium]
MLRNVSTEVVRAGISLLAISALSFFIIAQMPSDPVMIAIRAWNLPATEETIAAMRLEWGLDLPLPFRYFHWLSNFVAGDWGRSFRTGDAILQEFVHRLPLSLAIGLSGLLLAILLAIPLGFAAALRPRGLADRVSRGLSIGVQAVPSFWLGLILLWVLGVQLKLIRPFANDIWSFLLPVALIALHSLGILARVYRRDLIGTTEQPHYRTALAKGLSRRKALWHHGHRAALYALLSAVRSEAGWAIGSTAALEILFGLPGISQFLVQSMGARDYFVLQAYVMVIAIWMIVVNGSISLSLQRLDPRSR